VPPAAVGDSTAVARVLDIALKLPAEPLLGTADRELGVVKPGDIDPTATVFVVGVGEDAALRGVTVVVGAGVVAGEPIDVVVMAGAPVMLPVFVPGCPLIWAAAGAASPTLSSKANLSEWAIADRSGTEDTVRTAVSAGSST
jgi:hypothetical protein